MEPGLTTPPREDVVCDLLCWGRLLDSVVKALSPLYRVEDLLLSNHPLSDSPLPLGRLVECFGLDRPGQRFLCWWLVGESGLLSPQELEDGLESRSLSEVQRGSLHDLDAIAHQAFLEFFDDWTLDGHRLVRGRTASLDLQADFQPGLWEKVGTRLGRLGDRCEPPLAVSLDQAIARVRSFFEPLESPLFGMNSELLAHHVRETIPREVPGENVAPIVPLHGKHQGHQHFVNAAQLPTHLRVILRRLEKSQAQSEIVTALLATLEAVDFTLRFATGLAQGCWAAISGSDALGVFEPTTSELIADLKRMAHSLRDYWDHSHAQPALHLLFQGRQLHPFLQWAGLEGQPRLLAWMIEAEEAIRQDNPGRCSSLSEEMMEPFNSWIREFVLLCSSWDVVLVTRQDGYLGISVARGAVGVNCKPLVDPTRYSVWLDRSELTVIDSQLTLGREVKAFEPLDARIMLCSNDPALLSEQISALLKAHEQRQTLPLGRSLFYGLEYLVRLHASLAGGYLRHHFDKPRLLEPLFRPGGDLHNCMLFLSYSQRVLAEIDAPESRLLRSVFFDGDQPRTITRWLGIDGVPGPLQGLLGWSLSLMRPDAANRLDEIRSQIPKFSSLFAEFVEVSRYLWSAARLQMEPGAEGAQATVCQFPSGLRIRGIPDIVVGHRVETAPTGVVIGGDPGVDRFSHWDSDVGVAPNPVDHAEPDIDGLVEDCPESAWPSFFEDSIESGADGWNPALLKELQLRCNEQSFSGFDGRPTELAREVAAFIQTADSEGSSISLVRGDRGSGRTLLCRTLVHPRYSPLNPDFPILYLKVDRFPETRLSTVVERLNDHIASESSLDRFGWVPVPTETLRSLGSEVDRLSRDLADLGQYSEPLACRLSSYLRCLQKLNDGREFLLLLDGFERVPSAMVPRVLSPGIHLLITGSDFEEREETSAYVSHRYWDLSQENASRSTFAAQFAYLHLDEAEQRTIFYRFGGSLLKARAFANLRENQDSYGPSPAVLEDLLAFARKIFPEPDRRESLWNLLCILGLYERPVPLRILESLGIDVEVANVATNSLPSLFSFWNEPEAALGLAHRIVFELLTDASGFVEGVAEALTCQFLDSPRRGDLLPALRWLSFSGLQADLIERFFANSEVVTLWREELDKLWREGLFFQRVALLDATEEPLMAAIEAGAGHLREELGWLHNARGLSLLKLGLLEEASIDLQIALAQFQNQFAAGEMGLITSIGSATNRLGEVALKGQDLERAERLSASALAVLEEGRAINDSSQLRTLTARALMLKAQICLQVGQHAEALAATESAHEFLREQDQDRFAGLVGEVGWYRAEALAGSGQTELACRELNTTVEQLLRSGAVESGLQALLLRARLRQQAGQLDSAYADLQRALSILRYRVFSGRMDLEPLLAYCAARRALTGAGSPEMEAQALSEFVDWARQAIRFEGRTDLRALLAYILLARGQCWKTFGNFARAVDDLRAATEQYDLLILEGSSSGRPLFKRLDSEPAWNGLRTAFSQMTALYVSLDEAPLAILAGRRALELAQRATKSSPTLESGLEIPTYAILTAGLWVLDGDRLESELYQSAKLYFHLGEATRRLNLERFATAYFEQAALGFERLFEELDEVPLEKLEEYRVVLKYVARSAESRRDYGSLAHWVTKLSQLPTALLTDFDHFSIHNQLGSSRVFEGELLGALEQYQASLGYLKSMREHPRFGSLRAETLLNLGRVLSLQGRHELALRHLEEATTVSQNVLFEEGEENRELLVRSALQLAVAHLRAGHVDEALDQLRILGTFRPLGGISEIEQLADDWVTAWQLCEPLPLPDLVRRLGQVCELGDWLLRTPLGLWFRELVTELVTRSGFLSLVWDSARLDQVIETFLVVAFSQTVGDNTSFRATTVSDTGELQRLLKAKYCSLEKEGRLVEAELALSHLVPARLTSSTGKLLLRRSEMALRRGDRGVGIVDLLRATESRGKSKVQAHLRLAEFLLSRDLQAATALHLRRSLFSLDDAFGEPRQLLERVGALMTGLVRAGAQLEAEILKEFLRACSRPMSANVGLELEPTWLKALGDYRDWSQLLEVTLNLLGSRQASGGTGENDWRFLEEVLERTVLYVGSLTPLALKELGQLLVSAGVAEDAKSEVTQAVRDAVWERFIGLLPVLGRREGLDLVRRLFEFASGKGVASAEGRSAEFLARLKEEKRLLSQPR